MNYLRRFWKPIAFHASIAASLLYLGGNWVMWAYILGYTIGIINGEWIRRINESRRW